MLTRDTVGESATNGIVALRDHSLATYLILWRMSVVSLVQLPRREQPRANGPGSCRGCLFLGGLPADTRSLSYLIATVRDRGV